MNPLPGNPVNVACGFWPASLNTSNPIELIHASRSSANLFFNYSNSYPNCFNLSRPALSSLPDLTPWYYQACTEMVLPLGFYGAPDDLFYPDPWSLEAEIEWCQQYFDDGTTSVKVTPQPLWVSQQYGSNQDWGTASNIVFTNGNLDPWHGGGVLHDLSPTVTAIFMEGAAHHLDLRSSNPLDPPSVVDARKKEVEWIHKFIQNPNPQAGVSCEKNKMSTAAVVLISVGATLGAVIISFALHRFCFRKMQGRVEDRYSQQI